MNRRARSLDVLTITIALFALVASGLGVFWVGDGQPYAFRTLRGETVTIHGHGLYRHESVSIAAQAIAQDVVTLLVGIPLLMGGWWLCGKGKLRGKLLHTGTLAYFLYAYASYAFGAAYNVLFLLYVALFSLSLFATVLAFMNIDVHELPKHFRPKTPRRSIAVFLFVIGAFLSLAWLGRILPALRASRPPYGLESYTTLVIQTLDLGVIVPVALVSGILLWKRRPWGYLLSSVVLIKAFTLAVAVSAMAINMVRAGVDVDPVETAMFPILTVVAIGMTIALLKNVSEEPVEPNE